MALKLQATPSLSPLELWQHLKGYRDRDNQSFLLSTATLTPCSDTCTVPPCSSQPQAQHCPGLPKLLPKAQVCCSDLAAALWEGTESTDTMAVMAMSQPWPSLGTCSCSTGVHFAAGTGVNHPPAALCVPNTELCFDSLTPSPLAHQPTRLHKLWNCVRQSTGVTQALKQLSSKKTQTTDTAFTENGKTRTTRNCAPKSRKLQLPELQRDPQAGTEEAQNLKFTHAVTSKI